MKCYCTYPDVFGGRLVFVSDDDLWSTDLNGNSPQRLTTGFGIVSNPRFSHDGKWIAFCGALNAESSTIEVYLIPSEGGEARRLTYFGSSMTGLAGWTDRGEVVVATDAGTPFLRWRELIAISTDGKKRKRLNLGPASTIEYGENGVLLGRNTEELLFWKRYRGGRRGKVWFDSGGKGKFRKFLEFDGNVTSPMFFGNSVFFVCDHEGTGNLYSVDLHGKRTKRHTSNTDFYVRNARTDGSRIVYQSGGDIFVYDPNSGVSRKVDIDIPSNRQGRTPRFVSPSEFAEDYSLSPAGERLSFIVRGKPFVMGNWEGAVTQPGVRDGVRYKFGSFMHDGKSVGLVSDESGEEKIEIYGIDGKLRLTVDRDFGIIEYLEPSPSDESIAVSNNRFELHIVDASTGKSRRMDRSEFGIIEGLAWSPDGKYLAYEYPESQHATTIRLAEAATGKVTSVTTPNSQDFSPAFDPDGRYLYFLSYRELNPVYDKIVFDLGFPKTAKPFIVTLRKDVSAPFLPSPRPLVVEKKDDNQEFGVDTDGIADRVEAFPVEEGDYVKIAGVMGKALFLSFPVEGAKRYALFSGASRRGTLTCYDFDTFSADTLATGVTDFVLSADSKTMLLRFGTDFRIVKSGEKIEDGKNGERSREPGRKTGFVNLNRMRVRVEPPKEWSQMLRETWRRMRENYWREDLHGVDWTSVHERYAPLLDKIGTRNEMSEILKELQGELGTSHSYERGGDYNSRSPYAVGSLGAEFRFGRGGYVITKILRGDTTNEGERSPLIGPGVNVSEGDVLLSINGIRLDEDSTPEKVLENLAGEPVTIAVQHGRKKNEFTVRTLRNDKFLCYRSWVEANRNFVHEHTGGKVGYVHIPDMGPNGFAEFHRLYAVESERDGMIVDVRYNTGGHVSSLLLEKLTRKRIAYGRPRRGKAVPYPRDSVKGPLVALTNENAGSDGDIFSHGFKLYRLGPLIGTRTWGGVIGINPRSRLVDGTFVTQPQFAFWFKDVGWGVENYGTDPTVELEITPQDYNAGHDVQLERGVEEIKKLLRSAKDMLDEPPNPAEG